MKNDHFNKQVTSKLDALAHQHRNKAVVMENVLTKIKSKSQPRLGLWRITGFAAAAAIMGVVVIPGAMQINKPYIQQVITTPKLSPQMVEDLEMLSVFAEDRVSHDS